MRGFSSTLVSLKGHSANICRCSTVRVSVQGHDRDVAQLFLSCKQLDVRLVLMERTVRIVV